MAELPDETGAFTRIIRDESGAITDLRTYYPEAPPNTDTVGIYFRTLQRSYPNARISAFSIYVATNNGGETKGTRLSLADVTAPHMTAEGDAGVQAYPIVPPIFALAGEEGGIHITLDVGVLHAGGAAVAALIDR